MRQIEEAFAHANPVVPELLRQAIADGRLNPEIALDSHARPPRTPECSGVPAQITLYLSHLEFLWAYTYSAFVAYEAWMRASMVEAQMEAPPPEFSPEVQHRARCLGQWARSLVDEYTVWPADLPSPRDQPTALEREISKKVNTIFLGTVSLLLHHEFAHGVLGHLAAGASRHEDVLEMEKEADVAAYDSVVGSTSDEQHRRLGGWSVLVPFLSSLYLARDRSAVYQRRHPDLHHRLNHALDRLCFVDLFNRDYFTVLCCHALFEFVNKHELRMDNAPDRFESAPAALAYYLDVIDRNRPNI